MQELRRNHPDWLEQRKISFTDGHAEHYVSNTLVISHCWEDSEQPDGEGVQFAAIKEHLLSPTRPSSGSGSTSGRCRRAGTRPRART